MDVGTVRTWLTASAVVLREQRDYLTQLDAAIGDADHGTNMDRGFAAVVERLEGEDDSQPPEGAAAHSRLHARLHSRRRERPSLGTALRRAGRTLGEAETFGPQELAEALARARRRRRARCQQGREDDGRRARARRCGCSASASRRGGARGSARRRTRGERGAECGPPCRCRRSRGARPIWASVRSAIRIPATSTALILAALERSAATAA